MALGTVRARRSYQAWVANETIEDYSLRYAASSFRKWSPFVIANTALGGISFLALEAIGGAITISYGFSNAFPAIIVVCLLIFAISLPIAYYASKYNIDMDLLTRGAGFGYIGSTVTSLIYACFTFIFFALEAAIMAQALYLYTGLPIALGYIVSSIVIIPIVFLGATLISKLQLVTQPIWLLLLITPFVMILLKEPEVLDHWVAFAGDKAGSGGFNFLYFGAATGVLFALVVQIGEQVDYLRFMPDKSRRNRWSWWAAVIGSGPGWIVIGGLKILAGSLLAVLVVDQGQSYLRAVEPIYMYVTAYGFVSDDPWIVLTVATIFVLISQVKINVTNAYAGSLAWSNFYARVTHYHPGRVVWLVFNILISLLLMLLGIFETLQTVLAVYSIVAIAWIGAIFADLAVLKPIGISPSFIEFRRAHLYNINPVGTGAMVIASVVAITAFEGGFGAVAEAYAAGLSLITAFVGAIAIGVLTKGRYYIAREDDFSKRIEGRATVTCSICAYDYEPPDMAHCPFYEGPICSLCCSLDAHCHDACKRSPETRTLGLGQEDEQLNRLFPPHFGQRLAKFFGIFLVLAVIVGALLLLAYRLFEVDPAFVSGDSARLLTRLYLASLVLICVGAGWIVLAHESRELAERELVTSLEQLNQARRDLAESERMAAIKRERERLALIKERDMATAALKARNLDLEALNQRLQGLVGSMQQLSSCTNLRDLSTCLVQQAVALTAAEGGKVSLTSGEKTVVEDIRSAGQGEADILSEFSLLGSASEPIGTMVVRTVEKKPLPDEDRELIQILVSYASEVVYLLQALDQVSWSELRLRDIIDHSPSLISLQDLAGRFLITNKRFEEWHGYAADQVTGRTATDLFPPEIAALYLTSSHRPGVIDARLEQEIEMIFADGSVHTLLTTRFPVHADERGLIGVGMIATDVTERRHAEEHLRQAQKMEALGQLTGGVAHDFNNLLAVIYGNLSLIRGEIERGSELAELADDAAAAAKAGADLTDRLLAFGRQQNLHPEPTDAGYLLVQFSRVLERTLGETIAVKLSLDDGLWPIDVDRGQLETSILNLALNARDAMPEGGVLEIAALNVPSEARATGWDDRAPLGDCVEITVSDNGEGMSSDVRARAVQPFFTTKTVGQGSGLGLSMVYGFVQQSGGHFDISSKIGEGTTVRLFLPRSSRQLARPDEAASFSSVPEKHGEQILLVEDQAAVRRLANRILTRQGYHVLEAADGKAALRILAGHAGIDLLFTDVVLPGGMSGVELARAAKADRTDLRVLYASGYASELVLDDLGHSEDTLLVRKPFHADDLIRLVRRTLDQPMGSPQPPPVVGMQVKT